MDFKTNTGFNIANTSSHEDFDDDYILIYKDINNILDDIGFQGDDRILCKSIIESLEKEASINIRKDKCVAIPHIGTIQKNWYRSKLISHYKDFKEARKTMTREEYKEYTAKVMEEEKQKHYEEEENIKNERKFKKKLLPTWVKLSKKHSIIVDEDSELITLLVGEDVVDEEVEEIESYIEDNFDAEVDIIEGKQPVYSFIIGVE